MKLQQINNPQKFLESIPRGVKKNVEYRRRLHSKITKDEGLQKAFLELCFIMPEIAFNSCLWTFDPRQPAGLRNRPFILRPKQGLAVRVLKEAIDQSSNNLCQDVSINKSREEGATEIIVKLLALYWTLCPESMFLIGSRKEDYVDRAGTDIINVTEGNRVVGDHKCLFHKVLYAIAHMPLWMQPRWNKTHMHFENIDNGSVIDGESTNENFGAGDRRLAILLDEFGRVDHSIAKNIRDTINDTSNCIIYNSTHFYGAGHPFNKIVKSKAIKTIILPWYENPEKNAGLYKSPDINEIEIVDIDYYRNICPEVFDSVEANNIFKYSDFETKFLSTSGPVQDKLKDIRFIADGCEPIPGDLRSPWHDRQEQRRTRRDLSQNIWMNPTGASDMYFDAVVNDRIRAKFLSPPKETGEIKYEYTQDSRIKRVWFDKKGGRKRLQWWGQLFKSRPNQSHNFILASDISLGTGASNSVCSIMDVNTNELVGVWACPETTPENFADQVIAIAKWVGGATKPYIIWENNGGHGINFGRRIVKFHHYYLSYTDTNEVTKTRKRGSKWGWNSNTERKDDILSALRIALAESLKTNKDHKWITIYDEDTIDELDDYIYYESGQIGSSESADEKTGARSRHGDRVIALALCLLATKEQRKAVAMERTKIKVGSMAYRLREHKREKKEKGKNSPWLVN